MKSHHPALVFAWIALAVASVVQSAEVSDAEAAKHVGEEATVTGKVVTVSTSGKGTTFLNFGDRFPRHTFGVVIFASNQGAVGDVKQYEGKEVSVTGKIEMSPDQKPQIVVSKPDQLQLAGAANPPAPSKPVATNKPMPTPPASAPVESPPASIPASGKIDLGSAWNTPRRGGEQTRKDLARLFGDVGSPGETTMVDTSLDIYSGVSFLMPFSNARRMLNLDGTQWNKVKVTTPGFPQDSFNAYVFEGVFPGGFTRLHLVTDNKDQVVSVLLVDSSGRTRVTNEPDTMGYHTYNFISHDWKATGHLVIRHKVTPAKGGSGIVTVDTLLVDATDIDTQTSARPGKKSSSSSSTPKTGKVLERSRWYVPMPIVNLILRCIGG